MVAPPINRPTPRMALGGFMPEVLTRGPEPMMQPPPAAAGGGGSGFMQAFQDPAMQGGLLALAGSLLQARDKGQSFGGALGSGLLNMQQMQQYLKNQELETKDREQRQKYYESRTRQEERQNDQEAQRQALLQAEIAKLPPDQQSVAMADPDAYFKGRAEQLFAAPKPPQVETFYEGSTAVQKQWDPQAGWVEVGRGSRFEPKAPGAPDLQLVQVANDDGTTSYVPEAQAVGRSPPKAGGAAPDLVTIADPANPGQSIMVDKVTGQPFMVGGEPARPASARDAGQPFSQAKDLRTGFEKQTADAREVATSYRKIESGFKEDSGAGDIAGIFGYMKMLDPTSVVREGEFATAANSAGVPEAVRSMYNRVITGEKLSPQAREQMLSAAASQLGPYRQRYEETSRNYTELATKFGVDPSLVVLPLAFPDGPQKKPPAPSVGGVNAPGLVSQVFGGP